MSLVLLIFNFMMAFAAAADSKPGLMAVSSGQKPLPGTVPAAEPKLVLKGSRGETLNFMLEVPAGDCAPMGISPMQGPGKFSPELRIFEMGTIQVDHPSFPGAKLGPEFDPLLPSDLRKICPASAPVSWYWGEIGIPADSPPGKYTATLKFGASANLPVEITVWKMKIPDEPALQSYTGLSTWYLTLGHHGKWAPGEEILDRRYSEELYRHRIVPIQNNVTRPELIQNGEHPKLDLKNQPSQEKSFATVVLKNRPKWAYFDFPSVQAEDDSKPQTASYFKAIEDTLPEIGRKGKAFVYLRDEPTPEAIPEVVKLAQIVKANAPDLKVMVTTVPKPELDPWVDIYVPVMDQFGERGFPPVSAYEKLVRAGKEIWWYVSCMSHGCDALMDSGRPDMVIERPASYIRSIAWISAKYSISHFLYYTPIEAYRHYPDVDPWKSLWLFSGNGDGTLFYPGRTAERGFKDEEPVASIRLKLWRETSFDAEYIRWMNALQSPPEWWRPEFNQLVKSTTNWERDYAKFQALRNRAGEYLNQTAK